MIACSCMRHERLLRFAFWTLVSDMIGLASVERGEERRATGGKVTPRDFSFPFLPLSLSLLLSARSWARGLLCECYVIAM